MDEARLARLLEEVARGQTSVAVAASAVRNLLDAPLGWATVDRSRALRCGNPEVIFCPGKTPEQVAQIATRIVEGSRTVLATRADRSHWEALVREFPDAVHHEVARAVEVDRREPVERGARAGLVAVLAAGTADIPVAEEARITARWAGAAVETAYDVGVAGLQRLLDRRELLERAGAVVVAAGMDAALPSVVGGLVRVPVVAVPTSVGYGASFGGLAALLALLTSCAPGVVAVNIDNGFGAGYAAALIVRGRGQFPSP
ncbi:MAG: nickel pincer cofactor biosynthesis protein LarB [Planctomycetes bacterium]|nr:nickel pincer cofactor biosynthesis protein LarB [Planctomycetota bacterium]